MFPVLRVLTLLTISAPIGLMAAAGVESPRSASAAEAAGSATFPVPGYVVSPEEAELLELYRSGEGFADQNAVNRAWQSAVVNGYQAVVEKFLNPERPLRAMPDQRGIYDAYKTILYRSDLQAMRALLEPHLLAAVALSLVPECEREPLVRLLKSHEQSENHRLLVDSIVPIIKPSAPAESSLPDGGARSSPSVGASASSSSPAAEEMPQAEEDRDRKVDDYNDDELYS